jgi:ATP-binding cassette subfamily C protein
LSDGERQLIALARAYLSPAPIAILDEATSHLDPAAEARAELAFARRPGTLIVIAHRMSSALRARRVLVLGDERVHIGDHASLLTTSAMYRDLVGYWSGHADDVPDRSTQFPGHLGGAQGKLPRAPRGAEQDKLLARPQAFAVHARSKGGAGLSAPVVEAPCARPTSTSTIGAVLAIMARPPGDPRLAVRR